MTLVKKTLVAVLAVALTGVVFAQDEAATTGATTSKAGKHHGAFELSTKNAPKFAENLIKAESKLTKHKATDPAKLEEHVKKMHTRLTTFCSAESEFCGSHKEIQKALDGYKAPANTTADATVSPAPVEKAPV